MAAGWIKAVPNLITGGRIGLSAAVFFLLVGAAGVLPGEAGRPAAGAADALLLTASVVFAAAAITDYFDGWLARRLDASSPWGAVLDPIADKIAVLAAILGLSLLRPGGSVLLPGFLILLREVFVSGLREGVAPLGVKLPVTRLAKWKTTIQLAALALQMLAARSGIAAALGWLADGLLWLAVVVTLVTGGDYARGAARALRARS